MANSGRKSAYKALIRIEQGGYSNVVLNNIVSRNNMDKRDRDLAFRIFYGVLERRITLDYVISKYSRVKVSKLDKEVSAGLRMGVYELVYNNSPEYAVINEVSQIVKESVGVKRAGFVNAVLRNFVRDGKKTVVDKKDNLAYYSLKYSVYKYMVKSLTDDYGKETAIKILETYNGNAPTYIRVNFKAVRDDRLTDLLREEGFECRKTRVQHCLEIKNKTPLSSLCYKKGYFHIQDLSSQIVAKICASLNPKTVLDVAAAPGGKAFTISQETDGKVLACDVNERKVEAMKRNINRLGLKNTEAYCADALTPKSGLFDLVLCDLPCSGWGVIKKKPEIRFKPYCEIKDLNKLQLKILNTVKHNVKPGGFMVYSTCTLRKEENQTTVKRFLEQNGEFQGASMPPFVKDIFKASGYELTIMPYTLNSDGFYTAVLKRNATQ